MALPALQWGIIVAIVKPHFSLMSSPSCSPIKTRHRRRSSQLLSISLYCPHCFGDGLILSEKPDYLDLTGIAVIAVAGIIIVRNPAKR